MVSNKTALLAVAAALAEQVSALNAHRHLHRALDKRAMETDWVTVWETVYVTARQEPPAAPTSVAVDNSVPKAEGQYAAAPSVTCTSIIVVPSQPAVQQEAPAPQAPAPQTTLAKAVKTTSQAPVVVESVAAIAPIKIEETTSVKQAPVATQAAPPASSSATAPSNSGSSSGGSAGFSNKRGLLYNDVKLATTFGAGCKQCAWAYNWDSESYNLDSKYSFVPMLWDASNNHAPRWNQNANKAIANGAKAILSFNEPDMPSQANMSPAQAAQAHIKYMNPYQGKVLVGAPCVTNSGEAGQGLQWLQSFMDSCGSNCAVDFCPVHWYSDSQYADTLFDHLEKAHKICNGKPVWLTEFAPNDRQNAPSFLEKVLPRLEQLDYLHAYSYFMVQEGNLMQSSNALSSAGTTYAQFA